MIRRYSAKSKDELLLMIWIDINQDFPVVFVESLVEVMREAGWDILRILQTLDTYAAMWRAER